MGEWSGPWSIDDVVDARVTGYWGEAERSEKRPHLVQVVRNGDITSDGHLKSTAPRFFSASEYQKARVQAGDVLLTSSGDVGKVCQPAPVPDLVTSNFVRLLRPNPLILSGEFLRLVLQSPPTVEVLAQHTGGSTIPNLLTSFFSHPYIALPPLAAQRRIVDLISAVDHQIEAMQNEHHAARRLRASVVEDHLQGQSESTTLGAMAAVAQGRALPKASQGLRTGPLSWFKIADMTGPGNEYGYNLADTRITSTEMASLKGRLLPVGSVVFPRVGAAVLTEKKRIMEAEAAVDENHLVLVPGDTTDSEFLLALMEWFRLADLVQPGAVPSLNMGLIRDAVVPATSPEQQRALGVILGGLRGLARNLDKEIATAQRLRATLLSDLLVGGIDVPDSYDALLAEMLA